MGKAPDQSVGLIGAVGIGVGSMLGAGVFVVWGPAVDAAGGYLVGAVAVAGIVALVNALSSAQLAARYPEAGGAYAYGRAELGPGWGLAAGLGFVVGKTASVAAVALAIGRYAWPGYAPVLATAVILAWWGVNALGVTRTAVVATAIGSAVLAGLGWLLVCLVAAGPPSDVVLTPGDGYPRWPTPTPGGFLAAAALVFFAFAGYARVATLGEEVRRPERTIPRAVLGALGVVLALYGAVAWTIRHVWGWPPPVGVEVPLLDLAGRVQGGSGLVSVLAPVAAGGALLALMAGVGRTAMAMARQGDLPRALVRLNGRGVPWLAEGASAATAVGLVWLGGLGFALALSSCAVLLYYAVANLAAARQRRAGRVATLRVPVAVSVVGAVACAVLAAALPWRAVLVAGALAVLAGTSRAWSSRRPGIATAD